MAKYKRCPYCKHKNLASNGICSKCNRLLDSDIILTKKKSNIVKKKKKFKSILFLIKIFLLFFIVIIIILFYLERKPRLINKTVDDYQEKPFSDKMDSIIYDGNYIDNKLIPVKDYTSSDPFKLINKNGQVIVKNIVNYVADYNSFHVITKKENNNLYYYLINNTGEILYKSKDSIKYYPTTNSWVIGDKLYYNNRLVKDNINVDNNMNYKGYYFAFVDKDEQGIISYDGTISYRSKPKKYNHFTLETTSILPNEQNNYCLLNDNYTYLVINCNTGNIIINNKSQKILELLPHLYSINDTIYYINRSGELVSFKVDTSIDDLYVEYLDDDKLLIDNFIYDILTNTKLSLNEVDVHSLNLKNIESLLNIQKEYCLNVDKVNYGLKYNGEEIIPCENTNIIYFANSIIDSLQSEQKIYIIINNNKKNMLYDVKNKSIILENVLNYSPYSIFLKYKEDNNYYIYNIITDEKIKTPQNTSLELHSNYFMIEKYSNETTDTNREYYNDGFKNIYLGK